MVKILDISLIGTGGMMPLPYRFLTSLVCRLNGNMIMIDCGEGTQVTLKMLGWGFKNIETICITHFHADHISGLPGLLLTIGNSGRTEPLTIIGPVGLKDIVTGLCMIAPELPFEIIMCEFGDSGFTNLTMNEFIISAFLLKHRMPCYAYRFDILRKGKFDLERAKKLDIPKELWSKLQKEHDVIHNGITYTSDMVLGPQRRGIRISYCTDSRPVEGLSKFVENSDLFICEGIYGEEEKKGKAIEHWHMIFSEAAQIAKDGNVDELWLTHFSPALIEPELFIKNATRIFPNTYAGYDRISKTIAFKNPL